MNDLAVEVRDLVCRYPAADRAAVDSVSFDATVGSTLALLGPNGSGKTTLFRVLATLLDPNQGTATLCGCDVTQDRAAARELVGIVFQSPALDRELTAAENLTYHGRLLGLSKRDAVLRAASLLERVGLARDATTIAKRLSGGMRRRVEIARALMARPRVLLMDEPTVGLDPAARRDVWSLVANLRREAADDGRPITLVVSTHLLDDLDADGAGCDRLVLLDRGKVVADDTPDSLRNRIGGDVVTLVPEASDDAQALADYVGHGAQLLAGRVRIEREDGHELVADLLGRRRELPVALREASVSRPTLRDVFLSLTGRGLEDE